jgi:hypothetical protein
MMSKTVMIGRTVFAGFLLTLSGTGWASGHLPTMTDTQTLAAPAACLAELHRMEAQDRDQIRPRTTDPDGTARERSLDSKGVAESTDGGPRYEGTLWTMVARYHPEMNQTQYGAEYERHGARCTGPVLTRSVARGYTSPSFRQGKPE